MGADPPRLRPTQKQGVSANGLGWGARDPSGDVAGTINLVLQVQQEVEAMGSEGLALRGGRCPCGEFSRPAQATPLHAPDAKPGILPSQEHRGRSNPSQDFELFPNLNPGFAGALPASAMETLGGKETGVDSMAGTTTNGVSSFEVPPLVVGFA